MEFTIAQRGGHRDRRATAKCTNAPKSERWIAREVFEAFERSALTRARDQPPVAASAGAASGALASGALASGALPSGAPPSGVAVQAMFGLAGSSGTQTPIVAPAAPSHTRPAPQHVVASQSRNRQKARLSPAGARGKISIGLSGHSRLTAPLMIEPHKPRLLPVTRRKHTPRQGDGALVAGIVQGDPSETTIASWSVALTASFADYDLTMTTAEASAITDYSALYVKLISS